MLNSIKGNMQARNQTKYKHLIYMVLFLVFCLTSCSSIKKSLTKSLKTPSFENSFHGLLIVDTETGEVVYDHHSDRYFTPASNVKLFTFYTAITLLPERIPTLKYTYVRDTLFAEGTGDPSWMHPYFQDSTAINWLKSRSNTALHLNNFEGNRFGPGWAWEDYDTYFSPEIGPMPLYGNVVSMYRDSMQTIYPAYFKNNVIQKDTSIHRDEFSNTFYWDPKSDTLQVPFKKSHQLTQKLLEELLEKSVHISTDMPRKTKEILYGIATDSLLKRMLVQSDNFLAEQLMVVTSSTLSDTLNIKTSIHHMLQNQLSDLKHEPRWVDGSGLSRYNLFTPKSMVQVLEKLHAEIPSERLFALMPLWDASGTITERKDFKTEAFIHAKSGSLGNNYNLSGYLWTKSGKLLIFSFMNNHFRIPTAEIRGQIYQTLKMVHETY